jgi:hypothetical protein
MPRDPAYKASHAVRRHITTSRPELQTGGNNNRIVLKGTFRSGHYHPRLFATCPKLCFLHTDPHPFDDHVALEFREEEEHFRESLSSRG